MRAPPLARYKNNIVAFVHELTPLRLNEKEQQILAQFENGARSGLGMYGWASDGLYRALNLTAVVILWRTLCFDGQLTGIYGKSQKKAIPWINALTMLVSACDPLIRNQIGFDTTSPRATVRGDDFWRIITFDPNEDQLESAKRHLTNVVYYDFEVIPRWLIEETQRSLKAQRSQTCSFAIFKRKPLNLAVLPDTEPVPYVDDDDASNTDD